MKLRTASSYRLQEFSSLFRALHERSPHRPGNGFEAPVLFHNPDSEIVSTGILLRRMSDARLPFDAFVFPNELHEKWQPAHRLAIYRRNLDWFRFWLQDIEDPNPAKAEQYERWRKLRELQCANRNSLRDYCNVTSRLEAPR